MEKRLASNGRTSLSRGTGNRFCKLFESYASVILSICGLPCSAETFRASSPFRVVDFQDYLSYSIPQMRMSCNNFVEYFRLTVYKIRTHFMHARQSDSDTCDFPISRCVQEKGHRAKTIAPAVASNPPVSRRVE
jgi:hypothetical protein